MTEPGSSRSGCHPEGERFRRVPAALWRVGPFGVAVLGPDAPGPVTLTGSGPALWSALEHPASLGELAARLAGAHGVEAARVAADIRPALDELIRAGAVVGAGS